MPKAKFGPQDLRRVFVLPEEEKQLQDLALKTKRGEETVAATRVSLAMFLSWGSQVEADEREVGTSGDAKRKGWLAAPIFCLSDIPEGAVLRDPDTGEQISIRQVVRSNMSHNYFYLPEFPSRKDEGEHYVDFRKICAVGIEYFRKAKAQRLATLTEESLNLLFSRLMWFFTRAEYFFRPVHCSACGSELSVDIRFHGQNFDAEPWE